MAFFKVKWMCALWCRNKKNIRGDWLDTFWDSATRLPVVVNVANFCNTIYNFQLVRDGSALRLGAAWDLKDSAVKLRFAHFASFSFCWSSLFLSSCFSFYFHSFKDDFLLVPCKLNYKHNNIILKCQRALYFMLATKHTHTHTTPDFQGKPRKVNFTEIECIPIATAKRVCVHGEDDDDGGGNGDDDTLSLLIWCHMFNWKRKRKKKTKTNLSPKIRYETQNTKTLYLHMYWISLAENSSLSLPWSLSLSLFLLPSGKPELSILFVLLVVVGKDVHCSLFIASNLLSHLNTCIRTKKC